jgi:hypothetical protein
MIVLRAPSRSRGITSLASASFQTAESWSGGGTRKKRQTRIEKVAWVGSNAGSLLSLSHRVPDNQRLLFHNSCVGQQMRCNSTNASRAYPHFPIYGSNCVMQLSPIVPVFEKTSGNGIITKSMGKILLQFAPLIEEEESPPGMYPRTKKYAYSRSGKIALSPEDVGALLYHVPKGETVSVSRNISADNVSSISKVLTVRLENDSASFIFDYVMNGTGGQENSDGLDVPLSVTASMGDFEVLQSVLRDSLPKLTGWSDLTNLNLENAVRDAKHGSFYQPNESSRPTTESRKGKSKFSTGGPGSLDRDIFSF